MDGLCPCGIFHDVDYVRLWNDQVAVSALKHEAGHLLGLCRNDGHGDGAHCRDAGCLMARAPDLLSNLGFLVGRAWKPSLCSDCLADLEASRSRGVDAKPSFAGPFLLRREDGYAVASLPGLHTVVAGDPEEVLAWREVLSSAKEMIRHRQEQTSRDEVPRRRRGVWCFHHLAAADGWKADDACRAQVVAALETARHDPNPAVRHVADVWLRHLSKKSETSTADANAVGEG